MGDRVAKTAKVITPKHEDKWEVDIYAVQDPQYPDHYFDVHTDGGHVVSVGASNIDQYIEVFTKIKKQLEKAGK